MKKRFMTGIMAAAMTMSMMFGANSVLTVHAEELTQIENPADVEYGETISEEDQELLKGMFDAEYYASLNTDVVTAIKEMLGDNYTEEAYNDLLFVHFCTCGIYEGRSLSEDFNVSVFASANVDLQELLGTDVLAYYKYAATHDLESEGRTITTLKEAAEAGITVANITNPAMRITPAGYYQAESLGIKSLQVLSNKVSGVITVNTAVNHEHATNNVDIEVVIADTSNKTASDNNDTNTNYDNNTNIMDDVISAERQLMIDTINKYFVGSIDETNKSFKFYVVIDQNAEFAVYNSEGIKNFTEVAPISCTTNYSADNVDVDSKSFREIEVSDGPYDLHDNQDSFIVDDFGASAWGTEFDKINFGTWFTEETFVADDGSSYDCVYQHVYGYDESGSPVAPGFTHIVKDDNVITVDRDYDYVTYNEINSGSDTENADNVSEENQQNNSAISNISDDDTTTSNTDDTTSHNDGQ